MKKLSNRKAEQLSKSRITNGIKAAIIHLETKLGTSTIEIKSVH